MTAICMQAKEEASEESILLTLLSQTSSLQNSREIKFLLVRLPGLQYFVTAALANKYRYPSSPKELGAYNFGPGSFLLDLGTIFLKGKINK